MPTCQPHPVVMLTWLQPLSCACRSEQRSGEQLTEGYARNAWRSEVVADTGASPSFAQLPDQQVGLSGLGLVAAAAVVFLWGAVGGASGLMYYTEEG